MPELTFKREDVYDHFVCMSVNAHTLDARGLLERLAVCKAQTGLQYFSNEDNDRPFGQGLG